MSDRLVKLLNTYGYQPVFLPHTGLVPPELYNFADHRLIRLGALSKVIKGQPPKFDPTHGDLPDIQGEITSNKNTDTAVGFLTQALGVLGISAPKISLKFTGSNDFVFAFTKVTYQSVDPLIIDGILQNLKLPLAIPAEYISSGAMHIAYEYAYAGAVTMRRKDGESFETDVSADIHKFIQIDQKVTVEVTGNIAVSFAPTGGTIVAFAYKAGRLERIDGKPEIWTFKPEVVQHLAGGGGGFVPAPGVVLLGEEMPITKAA